MAVNFTFSSVSMSQKLLEYCNGLYLSGLPGREGGGRGDRDGEYM